MSTQRDRWKVVNRLRWAMDKTCHIYTGTLYDDLSKCHARRYFSALHPRTSGRKYAADLPCEGKKLLDRLWSNGAPDLRSKNKSRQLERKKTMTCAIDGCGKPVKVQGNGSLWEYSFCSVACASKYD